MQININGISKEDLEEIFAIIRKLYRKFQVNGIFGNELELFVIDKASSNVLLFTRANINSDWLIERKTISNVK